MKIFLLAFTLLAVTGVASAQGTDSCTTPTVVTGAGPFPFNSTAATMGTEGQTEALCFQFGYTAVDKDVWFTWNATFTGMATVETCTPLTAVGNDTKIGVYPGNTCPANGTALGCNDDACGLRSKTLPFAITMGLDYVIQVGVYPDGYTPGVIGNWGVSASGPPPVPPVNDNCATPVVLSGPGTYPFDTTLATTGTQGQGATTGCGSSVKEDLWYTYTGTTNGTGTVTTCGGLTASAEQDSKIAVYLGAGCPAGLGIACNDDDANCTAFSTVNSTVTFPTTCGTAYTIQVGDFYSSAPFVSGTFTVSEVGTACSTPFTPFCFGDGTGTACPCSNAGGVGAGCGNFNTPAAGAKLTSTGNASVTTDTLVLHGTNALPFGPGLYFQGSGSIPAGTTFGNGLLCLNGATPRLEIRPVADVNGNSDTTVQIHVLGSDVSGNVRNYQLWYRDGPNTWCTGAQFNFSHAITLTWGP